MLWAFFDCSVLNDAAFQHLYDDDSGHPWRFMRCVAQAKEANYDGYIMRMDGVTGMTARDLARVHDGRGEEAVRIWERFLALCEELLLLKRDDREKAWQIIDWRRWHKDQDDRSKSTERVRKFRDRARNAGETRVKQDETFHETDETFHSVSVKRETLMRADMCADMRAHVHADMRADMRAEQSRAEHEQSMSRAEQRGVQGGAPGEAPPDPSGELDDFGKISEEDDPSAAPLAALEPLRRAWQARHVPQGEPLALTPLEYDVYVSTLRKRYRGNSDTEAKLSAYRREWLGVPLAGTISTLADLAAALEHGLQRAAHERKTQPIGHLLHYAISLAPDYVEGAVAWRQHHEQARRTGAELLKAWRWRPPRSPTRAAVGSAS